MDEQALAWRFKALLVPAAGLLVAAWAGWVVGHGSYVSLLFTAAIVGVICLGLFGGPFFWVITVASSFLGGTFPVLGGSFTPFQLLMATGVCKFLIEDVVMRRTRLKIGHRTDFLFLAGFMGVLTLHALHDRFGMRFLGSTIWGGRNYINVYIGLSAFFVIQSIPTPSKVWAKLPYVILAVTAFDLVIALITTIFPRTIYTIYPFYSAVSRAGLEQVVTGDAANAARLGSVGNFGVILITIVLASVSLRRILTGHFRHILTALIGGIAVLYSGFRTSVFNVLALIFVAGIRDLKWRVLLLAPLGAACLFAVSVVNSEFVSLPKQIQRSLVFIPGKWDTEMEMDAEGSNDFRARIWTLWTSKYFPLHPLLGRGFGFNSEWADTPTAEGDPYKDVQMVEVGNIHNGFFATLDAIGIVGTFFFIIWNLRLLARAFRVSFGLHQPAAMTLRFLALTLGAAILCYWMGATTIGSFLPQEFAIAAVFLRLQQIITSDKAPVEASASKLRRGVPGELVSP